MRVGWLAIVLAIGCGREEAYGRTSEVVTAPAGSKWQSASVSIAFSPGHTGVHSSVSSEVRMFLHLLRDGETKDVQLDAYLQGGDGPGDTPKAVYEQAKEPKFALSVAPDGGALGFSLDGGTEYRIVSFASEEPLYCAHATFGGDWSSAPSTRTLMLEILKSAEPPIGEGRLHLEVGEHPRGRFRFQTEFGITRDYVCAHLDDAELRHALVEAVVLPGRQLEGSSDEETKLVDCAMRAVAEHPEEQAALVAGLGLDSIPHRSRAARALAQGGDAHAELAIAKALAATPFECDESQGTCTDVYVAQASLAWAIATIDRRLGRVSAQARDALIPLTKRTHATVRVHATRALAIAPDEIATARLRELATEPCETPIGAETDRTHDYELLYEEPFPAACWAKDALTPAP